MKCKEVGLTIEESCHEFFEPLMILKLMGVDRNVRTLIYTGCGYGTFMLPASGLIGGKVVGIDIDGKMINVCRQLIGNDDISNVHLLRGDIATETTIKSLNKYKGEVDYITLFNILHCEKTLDVLPNAYEILNKGGRIGITCWEDKETSREVAVEIRNKIETIIQLALEIGFTLENQIELHPDHVGLVLVK